METKEIKLTDVCDFQGGTQPPKEEWINEPRSGYVRMLQIRDFTQSKSEHVAYVKDTQKLNKCKADDILIGRYGASVGKILTGNEGAYNVAIIKTIPDETKLLKKYLYYVLTGTAFQNFISRIGARAAQAGFNKDDLSYFKLHLPTLENQERIATILSKAEALIKQRKASINLLNDLVKFAFLKMFGDPVRNEKMWEKKKLDQLAKEFKYGTNMISSDIKTKDAIPILRIPNIIDGEVNYNELKFSVLDPAEKKKILLSKGDLLFVRTNGNPNYIARCAVFNDEIECGFASYLIRVKLKPNSETTSVFIKYIVSLPSYRKTIVSKAKTTAGNYNINTDGLKDFDFIIPPMELQNQFDNIVSKTQILKEESKKSLKELEQLFGALGQKAFRGELNLEKVQTIIVLEGKEEEKVIEKINNELEAFHKSIPHSGAPNEIDNTLRQLDAELQLRGEVRFWDEYVKYRIIKQKFSNAFTFDEFWKEFIKVPFDEPQSYDKIKELIFSLLKTDNPFLTQRFNESKKQIELLINETVTA